MKTIYLAGGCFWGTQKFFDQFEGVVSTEVGYANGKTEAPSYEQVCRGSGHAETVKLSYVEGVLPTSKLLEYYFMTIDPLSLNRQGPDTGVQYRTGIYYEDDEEPAELRKAYEAEQAKHAKPLAVELKKLENFFTAEEYHQKYLEKHPGGYCHIPGRLMLIEKMGYVKKLLAEAANYEHAARVLNFDQETVCPPAAMEEQGEVAAFLGNQAFRLYKKPEFINAAEELYRQRAGMNELDSAMLEQLHRAHLHTANITPELDHEFSLVYNRAFVNWIKAKDADDFSMFEASFKEVVETEKRRIALRAYDSEADAKAGVYDQMLGDYEKGITAEDLDGIFGRCRERLVPLLKKIQASPKRIRRDFMSRPVSDEQQKRMARYLLEVLDYDFSRGAFATSEHPFTDELGKNDIRITTHYCANDFSSSMYSVIHEGGHAIFDQLTPPSHYGNFISGGKTMGMHESVSRFYENRIGRSRAFIHLIYPKTCEIFPQVMHDVSEEELYEALNVVEASPVRTQADEFTYVFHIMIRYEIEREILEGSLEIKDVPGVWARKYREYLGITPQSAREGALQDVHWSSGLGYFPAYAIGNFYNSMYYNEMRRALDIDKLVEEGNFKAINGWMAENVFARADLTEPKQWIFEITGRQLSPDDFLDYLEEKYGRLYGL